MADKRHGSPQKRASAKSPKPSQGVPLTAVTITVARRDPHGTGDTARLKGDTLDGFLRYGVAVYADPSAFVSLFRVESKLDGLAEACRGLSVAELEMIPARFTVLFNWLANELDEATAQVRAMNHETYGSDDKIRVTVAPQGAAGGA